VQRRRHDVGFAGHGGRDRHDDGDSGDDLDGADLDGADLDGAARGPDRAGV
jgi:uncharacterized protein YjbI with pentapeptide repeats